MLRSSKSLRQLESLTDRARALEGETKIKGKLAPGVRNLESLAKISGYFVSIHNETVVDSTMSFGGAEERAQHCPALEWGLFLSRNKYVFES